MNYDITNLNGYSTMTFSDIYPTYDIFLNGIDDDETNNNIIGYNTIENFMVLNNLNNLQSLYYLLLGRYGNSPIANNDINQFSVKLFSIIFQFGPTWEKKLEIQKDIRSLDIAEYRLGTKAIHNHAYNPSTEPSTDSLTELDFINEQNTTKYEKSKLEGYAFALGLLETDVTEEFLKKFQYLFLQIARPTRNIYYGTEDTINESGNY